MKVSTMILAAVAGPLLASAAPLPKEKPPAKYDGGYVYYRLTPKGPVFLTAAHDTLEEQREYCPDGKNSHSCEPFNPAKPSEDILNDKATSFVQETVLNDGWEMQRLKTPFHWKHCIAGTDSFAKCEVEYGFSGGATYDPQPKQIFPNPWNAGPGREDGFILGRIDWEGNGARCLVGDGSKMKIKEFGDSKSVGRIKKGEWSGTECNFYHRIPSNVHDA